VTIKRTINVKYAKADIRSFVTASDIRNQFNSIVKVANTNTNNAEIFIPKNVIDFLNNKHLNLTLNFDGTHHLDVVVANLGALSTVNGTQGYKVRIPTGVLQNNIAHNSLNLRPLITMQAGYSDPSGSIASAISGLSKTMT